MEPFDKLLHLLTQLLAVCQDADLLTSEYDLFLDSALLLWKSIKPVFAKIHSHEVMTYRHLLQHGMGTRVSERIEWNVQ